VVPYSTPESTTTGATITTEKQLYTNDCSNFNADNCKPDRNPNAAKGALLVSKTTTILKLKFP